MPIGDLRGYFIRSVGLKREKKKNQHKCKMSCLCWVRICVFLFILLSRERTTGEITLDLCSGGGAEKEELQNSGTPGMHKS